MTVWSEAAAALKEYWHVIAGAVAALYWIVKSDNRSKTNQDIIARHEDLITHARKRTDERFAKLDQHIAELSSDYSKQEARIDQLFAITQETRDGVNLLLDHLLNHPNK